MLTRLGRTAHALFGPIDGPVPPPYDWDGQPNPGDPELDPAVEAIRDWARPDPELGWTGSPAVHRHAGEIVDWLSERQLLLRPQLAPEVDPAADPEPADDSNGQEIFARRDLCRQTTILDLVDRPEDGPLVYSDRDRTTAVEPTVELLLYRADPVPTVLRVDLG